MKQTVTANISGIVFHIEVDAYEKLNKYLDKIRGYFKNSADCDEIMADIESRIAELLNPKIREGNQVIAIKDVDEVITIMGKPEDYVQDEMDEDAGIGQTETTGGRRLRKRMFRDPDDHILGGVCAGMAHYFGIDPVFMRLLFVIAFFLGFGFLTYIILWIVIPKARTASEKLQMKGEPVNIENIGKTFEEGARNFEKKVRDFDEKKWSGKVENFAQSIGDFLVTFFQGVFKAIAKIIGIGLIILGVFLAIALIGGWLGSETSIHALTPDGIFTFEADEFFNTIFNSSKDYFYAKIALLALLGIPVIGLIFTGFKLLLGIRGRLGIGIGLGIIWTVAAIVSAFIGFSLAADFKSEASVYETRTFQSGHEQIILKMSETEAPGTELISVSSNDFFFSMDSLNIYQGYPVLDVRRSKNDSLYVEVEKISRGVSRKTATERARNIEYKIYQDDNLLQFDSYYNYSKSDKIRAQELKMAVYLPVGTKAYFDPSIEFMIYDVQNVTDMYDEDMLGHTWEMREEGLTCLDCEEEEELIN